jgi:folylpolyglutamate synthase/dihydropteroate synthase
MKKDRPCFSVIQQEDAWEVFQKRANEKEAKIGRCRPFNEYGWSINALEQIKTHGRHQQLNIALSLQLSRTWFLEVRSKG